MAKDPAFLFYPGDWLGGTHGMSFEEKGAYMELLIYQFNRGHMTSHMAGHIVGQLWEKVRSKFIQDSEGLWYNERLDLEKNLRKNYTESRKNNLKGKNQYSSKRKKRGHMTSHMNAHMENENINEDINRDKSKNENAKKNNISEREQKFITDLAGFLPQYPREMLNDFHRYWSEKNQAGTKMRFELQKTWDLNKRLITWSKNSKNFSNGKQPTVAGRITAEQLERFKADKTDPNSLGGSYD